MKISAVTDEISLDIFEAVRVGVENGLDTFEIRMAFGKRASEFTKEEIESLLALKNKYGINYSCVSPGLFKTVIEYDGVEEVFGQVFEMCEKLGIKTVLIFGPRFKFDHLYDEFVTKVKKICAAAREFGITLAIENSPSTTISNTPDLIRIIADVNEPNFKINWDPANYYPRSTDYKTDFDKIAPHICNVHVKNCVVGEDRRPVYGPVDVGEIDYPFVLDRLAEINYNGLVSIETHSKNKMEDFLGAVAYLKSILK